MTSFMRITILIYVICKISGNFLEQLAGNAQAGIPLKTD